MAGNSPDPTPRPWTVHDANAALHECLSTSTLNRPALPNEIILQILDHPSRWVQAQCVNLRTIAEHEPLRCSSDGGQEGKWQILVTDPLSAYVVARLRAVVYSFHSQDQGWSSFPQHHGTYEATWTWFEASLTRFEDPDVQGEILEGQKALRMEKEQTRYELRRNRHAGRDPENYTIELVKEHELLKLVQNGDRFALWACAAFPGWVNRVHQARIELWCVDDLAIA